VDEGQSCRSCRTGRDTSDCRSRPNARRHVAFDHIFKYTVQVVLLFYGLVNGGVVIGGEMPGAWAVLLAALIGRPASSSRSRWLWLPASVCLSGCIGAS
jgi:hypothetical protein